MKKTNQVAGHITVPKIENGLIRAHGYMALLMVVVSALFGIAVAIKFNWPDFLGGSSVMTWGRLRYCHTQGIFFGWLGNAFLAFFYFAVPRLTMRPITNPRLGWFLFIVWNFFMVLPGWILMLIGFSQPLEWAEFPILIDYIVIFCFLMLIYQFVMPFLKGKLSNLYVTGWYILGAILFTTLAYPVGNLVPEFLPGAQGATFSGLWIHDSIGLWVTPIAVGIAYFVIPATTGRPIYSHFVSMIGFWLLFFVYPLNGTHHYIFSSIPMEAQMGAIVASVYLGMDVILVVTNQLMSLRGSSGKVAANLPLRFTWAGIIFYLIVSMQGAMQALMPVNRLVHFTDWVIGHSHLAMLGFASFAAIGGLLHVWKNTVGCRYNKSLANWSFWLLTIGLGLMVVDLTIAGMVQGQLWQSAATWMDSVNASRIYWMTRTISGIPVLAGFICLCISITTGKKIVAQEDIPESEEMKRAIAIEAPVALSGKKGGFLGRLSSAYVYTGIAGIGFFALSFIVLAVWPSKELEYTIAETKPDYAINMTDSELRGRSVYAREGCAYCHTQMVRSTDYDVRRFGPVSRAWESDGDYPQMWGTRRIGPDLARESKRRPTDWQMTHLYDPRYVVPRSIMPRYPWLFNGSANSPTQEAVDLVAYIESLGRNAQLAGLDLTAIEAESSENITSGQDLEKTDIHSVMDNSQIPLDKGNAPMLLGNWTKDERAALAEEGRKLFVNNCAGCHSAPGTGKAPAAESLFPKPKELEHIHLSDKLLSQVLWNGVKGTAMPSWHEMSLRDLRALAVYVDQLSQAKYERPEPLVGKKLETAQNLYAQNCALCHGKNGAGDGLSAGALAPPPTNFQQELPSVEHATESIKYGMPGTAMVHWRDELTEPEQKLLVDYVRSLFLIDNSNMSK